jgi:hypothetical protein
MQATVLQIETTEPQDPVTLEIGRFKAASETVFHGLVQYVEAGLPIEKVSHMAALIAGGVQLHCWQRSAEA